MTTTDSPTNRQEPTMTTPTVTKNPYNIQTRITGWAVVAVFLGALWGAGHDPENASWSAFALVAIISIYAYNKIRQVAFNRYSSR
ncbi:hypothetical protein ACWKSP_26675 [Micromonosporaceae bacterium Da 78-11]